MNHEPLVKNPFPVHLLIRYKSPKPLPIPVFTHLEQEGLFTICKSSKYKEKGLWLQNLQKTTPKWPPKHAWRMWFRSLALLAITFWGFGILCLANQGKMNQKLLSPISQFDQIQREGVLTICTWYHRHHQNKLDLLHITQHYFRHQTCHFRDSWSHFL